LSCALIAVLRSSWSFALSVVVMGVILAGAQPAPPADLPGRGFKGLWL
jgi:hypothetical protein